MVTLLITKHEILNEPKNRQNKESNNKTIINNIQNNFNMF